MKILLVISLINEWQFLIAWAIPLRYFSIRFYFLLWIVQAWTLVLLFGDFNAHLAQILNIFGVDYVLLVLPLRGALTLLYLRQLEPCSIHLDLRQVSQRCLLTASPNTRTVPSFLLLQELVDDHRRVKINSVERMVLRISRIVIINLQTVLSHSVTGHAAPHVVSVRFQNVPVVD